MHLDAAATVLVRRALYKADAARRPDGRQNSTIGLSDFVEVFVANPDASTWMK
jgi:hypothetical protein